MPSNTLFEASSVPEKASAKAKLNYKEPEPEPEAAPEPEPEPESEPEQMELEIEEPLAETKPKKKRKELTPARKAQLAEQLKKARLTSAKNRTANAKKKKLAELKTLENEVATNQVNTVVKKVGGLTTPAPPKPNAEANLSDLEKRLREKYENEYSHKIKDYEINHLKSQLDKRNTLPPIKEIIEPIQKKAPVKDTISPCKNQRLIDRYKKLRGNRGF
tara:strand:+ start:1319 stop:1972 length:654 start_codon:yes stop_codon:yes gene_type:complete